ncbi:GPCR kinase [Quillaja saponaria]|uniref:GPCR kinase n=1 Tax=Quillaja saponaria TaxID=32244 RepID=A0AAD7KW41_QUISA|nr:GPCR kinase [Quillaja saponaria]
MTQLVANLAGLSFLDLSFTNLSGPTPKISAKGYRGTTISLQAYIGSVSNLMLLAFYLRLSLVDFTCSIIAFQGTTSSSLLHRNKFAKAIFKPINGSSKKVSSHHLWVLSVSICISCTFVVSLVLLVCWVQWYRSRILLISYARF